MVQSLRRFLSVSLALVTTLALGATVAFAQNGPIAVTINPVSGSGVHGTATVQPEGNRTRITVSANGLTPGSRTTAFFGSGTCANIGFPALQFSVGDLVAGADGAAQTSATAAVAFNTLVQGGPNQIHLATQTNSNIACGDVSASATAAMPNATGTTVPAELPRTGGVPWSLPAAALIGGAMLGLGAFLRRQAGISAD